MGFRKFVLFSWFCIHNCWFRSCVWSVCFPLISLEGYKSYIKIKIMMHLLYNINPIQMMALNMQFQE